MNTTALTLNAMHKKLQQSINTIEIFQADLDDPEHAQALLELIVHFAVDPMSGGMTLPSEVRKAIIPGLKAHPTTLVFLARSDRNYVGTAVCFTGFSTFYAKPLVNIHDLMVLEGYRGNGVGTGLMSAVEEKARQSGCCKVTLEVRDDNESAQGLYTREGYACAKGDDLSVKYLYLEKLL